MQSIAIMTMGLNIKISRLMISIDMLNVIIIQIISYFVVTIDLLIPMTMIIIICTALQINFMEKL